MAAVERTRTGRVCVNARNSRTLLALALQCAALIALALSLLGYAWLDPRSQPSLLVLVDRSESVPRADSDRALAEVVAAAKAAGGGQVQTLECAGRPGATALQGAALAISPVSLDPTDTNIEAALEAALAAHAQTPVAAVVVISDGLETAGDATRALRAMREARLPPQWIAVGRPPPPARVAQVLAPDRARVGQRIRISVQLAAQLAGPSAAQFDRALRVKASVRQVDGQTRAAVGQPDAAGLAVIEFDASRSGALVVDVALEDPASGQTLDAMPDAAVIDVAPRAAMLYAQGSAGPLARSLQQGAWALDVVPAASLDSHADGLAGYQAVVLDDVAISDASPRFWRALVEAVRNQGLGLMVLGGERSFARGGYRESTLESVLPVTSEPASLDQPVSVVFAVDKSGSMGQGSAGVDRFALAQQAVLETARALSERDSLGLVVFDVAPWVLIPLGPARAGTIALARDWQTRPNGGTKLAPALAAAITELERAGAARRLLILVTDGFVDDAPLADLRARLDRARIETIALAVGPDADADALQRLIGAQAGLVLRVDQAAELPLAMRTGLERRRARVERGTIAVTQPLTLPFAPGMLGDWPAIAAHAVTRPQAGATVAVRTQSGEPLIAWQAAGRGRVVAVTSGLSRWTPQWLAWKRWPVLAGGLATWASGTDPAVALAVSDLPGGLQVEADVEGGPGRSEPVSIAVSTPTTRSRPISAEEVAPGRLRAVLPDAGAGLYTFVVSTAQGTRRQLHLRRHRSESAAWGTNPALEEWRSAGLISPWNPSLLAPRQRGTGVALDRSLLALGLLLFMAGVVVDRARLDGADFRSALGRWRRRAQ